MTTGDAPLATFVAEHVPRYGATDFQYRAYENALGQRALWSGLAFLALEKSDRAVEMRFTAKPNRQVELSLSLLSSDPEASGSEEDVRQIERLLPVEYGWRRAASFLDGGGNKPADNWRVARVVRRTEYLDLPYHSLAARRAASPSSLPTATTAPVPPNAEQPQPRGSPVVGLLSDLIRAGSASEARFLPDSLTHGASLLSQQYCIPLLGPIDAVRPRLRRLLEELVAAAPAAISICMRPLSGADLLRARQSAANLKRFLEPFSDAIASSGFADFAALRAIYDRYFLPQSYLMRVSIRVAATRSEDAASVATLLAATFGGLRAFMVLAPTRPSAIDALRADFDVPSLPYEQIELAQEREKWRKLCQVELGLANVRLPSENALVDFLLRFPHIYSLEEAERVASLPISDDEGLPGFDTRLVPPFSETSRLGTHSELNDDGSRNPDPEDRVRIGCLPVRQTERIDDPSKPQQRIWHTVLKRDLTKHALIVGSTGSGKTVATLFLIRELARLKVPFLIVEPVKTEYYAKLPRDDFGLRRFRFEGASDGKAADGFFSFDPMRLQNGVSVARHASYLKSCFEAAFPLEPILAMILDAGIRAYYTDKSVWGCQLGFFSRGARDAHRIQKCEITRDGRKQVIDRVHPSLDGFRAFFLGLFLSQVVTAKEGQPHLAELQEQWRQIFQRRFDALMTGMVGLAAGFADERFRKNRDDYDPFSDLLSGRTLLELDGIPDDEHKALMMAFVTTFLFERRQADDLALRDKDKMPGDDLKHVLVMEEAHRILANTAHAGRSDLAGLGAQSKSVSLFVDMLAEIRAYGQGLVIVEQIPTKIAPEAVKNTNLKIMLRLTAADDRDFLGAAMNFTEDQKRFVTSLRAETGRGVDMVVFEQQLDQPRLLTLPLPLSDGPIHEEFFGTGSERQ